MGLTVRLLGEFRIDGVDLHQLRSRKARQLLKRLALEPGTAVHPDRLVDDLWDDPPADPGGDLAVLVSRARKLVGSDHLVRTDGGYCLHADRVDRDDVLALVREAAERLESGDLEAARTRADAALRLDQGRLLSATDYVNAQRLRRVMQREFRALWSSIDCLLTPTVPMGAPKIGQTTVKLGDEEQDVRLATTRLVRSFNLLGLPALSMPCGLTPAGLPVSAQIVGKPFDEATILRVGAALEDVTDYHTLQPPL